MADFAALPLFTDAWLADTSHLSRLERGLYMDLLILIWRSPNCRVPHDFAWAERKLRCTHEEGEILRSIVAEFCQIECGFVSQKRLLREKLYVQEKRQKQSDRAKSRWNKDKDACRGNAAPHASGNAPSPTPTVSSLRSDTIISSLRSDITASASKKNPDQDLLDAGVEPDDLLAWKAVRKAKRAGPVTAAVMAALRRESSLAGLSVAAAIKICAERSWQGFRAEWMQRDSPARMNGHARPKSDQQASLDMANEAIERMMR
jgi:uncharacterized protein YdaU (DUF1376 family)